MESNRVFSLEELLGGKVTMVIPDMQRDYCWGDKGNDVPLQYKAATFVKGVLLLFKMKRPSILGLLYGYEQPADSQRINIIDGQQRLTTLYLLAGMLYRRTEEPALRQLLISDYQLVDDSEPRILYQSRREAFYFISDLVTHFFLNRDGHLSQLEKSTWYYASYDADPSVKSFISALRQIDAVLEEADSVVDFDFTGFSEFLRKEVKFLYCGFTDRATAEKTFITINTTGEPLTMSQKLRSLSIALRPDDKTIAERWNKIEDWMWAHRHECDIERMMDSYLATLDQPSGFTPEDFFEFADAYCRMATACNAALPCLGGADFLEAGDFAILPTVAFVRHFGDEASDADIRRFCHMLCNITRYQKAAANGSDTQAGVEMAMGMRNPDLLSLLKWHGAPRRLLNDEERAKLEFIARNQHQRDRAEELIACAESHPAINGKASRILSWCNCDMSILAHYVERLYDIFGLRMPGNGVLCPVSEEIDKQPSLDLLRRALLTVRHKDYPIVRRGDTVLSLCWNDFDWQRLMLTAPGLLRHIIDRCDCDPSRHPIEVFKEMISRFSDKSYPYYFIIKNEETINYARKRQLLRPCPAFLGVYDIKRVHPRWWVEQYELRSDPNHWMPIRPYGAKCLYTDHLVYNVAIDLYHEPQEKQKYRIEVFSRKDLDKGAKRPYNLRSLMDEFDDMFMLDQRRSRFFALIKSASDAVALFHALLKSVR
ncbi:MAG: DUF262 domain-containing protein [Bacteroidales bacterium]|nr:DUF262 domain-containing protein [Bacteroidales bacterium]